MPREPAPPAVTWSRPEPFGAWVRLGDATLVAVDHTLAARLGVTSGHAPTSAPRPLELHLAVTSRCPAPCEGCYLDARPDGHEPAIATIEARLDAARDAGVSTVALGGGEPLTRRDLGAIAEGARARGLVPVLTTSGIGLRDEQVAELGSFAQINVSHDGIGEAYADVRGFDGAHHAERAIRMLVAAGIPTGANVVLTRDSFPALEATAAHLADLGAGELQLLRYKPAGRAAGPEYAAKRLDPEQVAALWPTLKAIIATKRLRVRIDCALVPLLSASLLAEGHAPAVLEALGVFGCEAARHLGAMRVDGTSAACSFFSLPSSSPSSPSSLSSPPIALGRSPAPAPDRALSWDADPELERFRAYHAAPPEPCRSCALFPVCRGGCQVVSRHEGGALAPDPECPRVLAARAAALASPPG